jgi:NAD(P)H dehydrogenase (quinone)
MTIGITGATGQLGSLIIEKLKAKVEQAQIVALVRNVDKAASLGVEARAFDYGQPENLAAALDGITTLLLISSSEIGHREVQHRNVIEAARQAGVSHIVYTSLLHADRSPISLAHEHRATEQDLKASGIPVTILRNGWYTENYTASIPAALANNAFVGSAADGLLSLATRADYAEAAVAVLTGAGHAGKTYELAGDTAITLGDLAAEISRQTGKAIPYVNLPKAEFANILKGAGLPEAFADGLASWDVDASNGALFDDGGQLSKLINRPTTRLEDAVRAAL